jgi:type IV fimbrial biogenesis protein FimT
MQKARPRLLANSHAPLGTSLIELLVAIAVLAVLSALAIPSFASLARQYRVNAVTEAFMESVQLARVDAMRLGQDIVLRRNTGCTASLPTTADWLCGWRVFADLNGNHQPDAAEAQLQAVDLPPGVYLQSQGGGSPQYMTIDRYGQVTTLGQRFAVFPAGMTAMDGQLICFSTGTRLRTVRNAKDCDDQPAS